MGSVCSVSAFSGAQEGDAEDPRWPPEAVAPLQAGWCTAPSEGLAAPSRYHRPGPLLLRAGPQPPAQGLLATFFGLEMCCTFRVDNQWQQTEQEKAFITLQPAVTTVWMEVVTNQRQVSPAAPHLVAGALPWPLRTEGIMTLPSARTQLGRGSQPHSSD